jgi:hypothetical protein
MLSYFAKANPAASGECLPVCLENMRCGSSCQVHRGINRRSILPTLRDDELYSFNYQSARFFMGMLEKNNNGHLDHFSITMATSKRKMY